MSVDLFFFFFFACIIDGSTYSDTLSNKGSFQ